MSPLHDLLQKEMDRKDFLKHVGIAFVALFGFSAALKALAPQSKSKGYGGSAYGGPKR